MINIHDHLPSHREVAAVLRHQVEELPAIPVVALKLLQLTESDAIHTGELVRVIETDPAIAAKVLRQVNSATYGFRTRVSSMNHAVVLLGFSAIRTLALEVTLFKSLISKRHPFDQTHFWQHCLYVAGLCRALARQTGHPDPGEVAIAGLLHDMGKIIANSGCKVRYRDFIKGLHDTEGVMVDLEQQVIGLSHDRLGAYVCGQWQLPPAIIAGLLLHHQRFSHLNLPRELGLLVAIVSLANFLAWAQGLGSVKVVRHSILQPEVEEYINFDEIDLHEVIEQVNDEVSAIAEFYNFSLPTPEVFRQQLLNANIQLSRFNTKYYYLHNEMKSKVGNWQHIRRSLIQPHRSLDAREVVAMTLQAIQEDFHFDRVSVLHIDPKHRCLQPGQFVDATQDGEGPPRQAIGISRLCGNLVRCLRNNVPVLLGSQDDDERSLLNLYGVKEMGMAPIASNSHVMGILAVDNIASADPISQEDLATLAIAAHELGMALENARAFEEMKLLAFRDGLTKVYNRAYLEKKLAEYFGAACSKSSSLAIGLVDVDHFKSFNDTFGHQVGDEVLKLLASTMNKTSRPSDLIARYGGEEFVFVLRQVSHQDAVIYGERLRQEIEKLGRLLENRFPGHPLTVSIGISSFRTGVGSVEQLVREADDALYRAKEEGRNQVQAHQVDKEAA